MKGALRSVEVGAAVARPLAGLAFALTCIVSLAGCASISENSSQSLGSMPGIGLPANAPARPEQAYVYPAVHEMPPQRTTAVMTATEQRTLERELVSIRDQQRSSNKPAPPPEPLKPGAVGRPKPPKPAAARPQNAPAGQAASASSGRTNQ